MFNRVTVAVDMSAATDKLLACVGELRSIGTERVELVWVVDAALASVADPLRDHHLTKLETHKSLLESYGFAVAYRAPVGLPAQELVKAAQEGDSSLVIIGSRGENMIREVLLGSTVTNLIRLSTVPTLIERLEVSEHLDRRSYQLVCARKFDSLFLATDLSPAAREAERVAMFLAQSAKKVALLSVVDEGYTEEQIALLQSRTEERLWSMKQDLLPHVPEISVEVQVGVPATHIVAAAERHDATLIIMGTRGKGGLRDMILGSTAEGVSRRAKRPVLLVPAPPLPGE